MNPKVCRVEVQRDHLAKVSSASPDKALAELNALDADATHVEVILEDSEFGISRIIIRDNGTGFSFEKAEFLFSPLGGSWKTRKNRTSSGRFLHGKEGKGRFKAFALGRCVEWKIKNHSQRALEEGQSQIRKWKSEDVCPFKADTTSPVEIAKRQVFGIVAVRLAENMPSLDQSDKKTGSGKFSSDRGNRVIAQTSPSFRQGVPESANAREGKSRGIRTIIGPLGGLLPPENQSLPENKVVSVSDTQACCRD